MAHRPTLQRFLGELANTPAAVRLDLAPLTRDGVRSLVAASGAGADPDRVHDETGGNPFFVSEVLASGLREVPATVRDAVLARTASLGAGARRALGAVAVLGTRCPVQLITVVADCSERDVAACIENGTVVESDGGYAFRHELARRAVESTLAVDERAHLHRSALAALGSGGDDRRLAHHAIGCGDSAAVLRHARLAGERATRLGAHREAAEHFRGALRHGAPDLAERAALLEALSYECYLTEQLEEALAARLHRLDLAIVAGDDLATGDHAALAVAAVVVPRPQRRRRALRRPGGGDTLTPLGESAALAMAISNVAQLRMLAGDHAAAIETGGRAIAVARAVGDRDTEIHALNNVGTARLAARRPGRRASARPQPRSRPVGRGARACRARLHQPRQLRGRRPRSPVRRTPPPRRDPVLRRARPRLVALVHDRLARPGAARPGRARPPPPRPRQRSSRAEAVAITRIVAASWRRQVRLRRGEPGAAALLDEALALAEATGEAQRLVPVASARAEWAWLDGRTADIVVEVDRAWSAALGAGQPMGRRRAVLVARPRRDRAGRPRAAARSVRAALLAAPGRLRAPPGPSWVSRCGSWPRCRAHPTWHTAGPPSSKPGRSAPSPGNTPSGATGRRAGLPVPRPPRPSHQELPHRLTARELEVLNLLADGLSNSEIGAQLVLSEKTVGHHVSAVLRKLGAPTRSRAVAAALREGIVGQR